MWSGHAFINNENTEVSLILYKASNIIIKVPNQTKTKQTLFRGGDNHSSRNCQKRP